MKCRTPTATGFRLTLVLFAYLVTVLQSTAAGADIVESPRNIPVIDDVDILVVGGSVGGIATALQAAKNGASVFLVSSRSYLGTDICGTYRFWLEPGEAPTTPLGKMLFPPGSGTLTGRASLRLSGLGGHCWGLT